MLVRELVGMGRSPYTGFWGKLSKDDKRIVEESIALVRIEEPSIPHGPYLIGWRTPESDDR